MKGQSLIIDFVRQGVAKLETEIRLYLDIVFLQNFLLDSFLLVMTGKMTGQRIYRGRAATGAAAGALWACVSPFFAAGSAVQLSLAFGPVSVLMVYLAYRERKIRALFCQAGVLCLTAAFLSGCLGLLKRITYETAAVNPAVGAGQGSLPLLTLLFGAGAICFFACFLLEAGGRERRLRSCQAEAVLLFKGKQIKVQAFLDTVNQLYDPIFRRPVSVIWEGALNGLFDEAEGTAVIPYRSVGKERGVLPAVAADGIRMELFGQKKYFKRPLIAISKTPLSSDGSYELLLHTEIWEQAVSLSHGPWSTGGERSSFQIKTGLKAKK